MHVYQSPPEVEVTFPEGDHECYSGMYRLDSMRVDCLFPGGPVRRFVTLECDHALIAPKPRRRSSWTPKRKRAHAKKMRAYWAWRREQEGK